MKQTFLWLFLLAFLLGFSSIAGAVTVTVEDNLGDNLLIKEGKSVSGQFDINPPVLPDDGNYNTPYDIASAVATFTFTDDGDKVFKESKTVTSRTNWDTCEGDRYEVVTTYDYYVDENDEVKVNFGAQVSRGGTSEWKDVTVEYNRTYDEDTKSHQHAYTYKCNEDIWGNYDICTGYNTHYVTTHQTVINNENTSGNTGELTIDVALDDGNIEDLSLDGKVKFTVAGVNGDIIFNKGSLTAEVNPNPVPEPATMLLLGAGLAAFAACGRKREIS